MFMYVYDADSFALLSNFDLLVEDASSFDLIGNEENKLLYRNMQSDSTLLQQIDYNTDTVLSPIVLNPAQSGISLVGVEDSDPRMIFMSTDGFGFFTTMALPGTTPSYELELSPGGVVGGSFALGSGSPPTPPALVEAYPTNWRTVRVVLSEPPDSALYPTRPGDALNPAVWSVIRDDNDFAYTIAVVAAVDSVTFDVTMIETLPSSLTDLTADIKGMIWAQAANPAVISAQKRQVTTDLANPATQRPFGGSGGGGTLIIQGGDYANSTGAELVRKLLYRRLTTAKGAFFHLPDYGVSILSPKALLNPNDLVKVQAEVEAQCKLEPEVVAARAQLALQANGVLFVTVKAKLAPDGQEISVTSAGVAGLGQGGG
jgi:hypothetical protein